MGEVIQFDHDTWMTMRMVQGSIKWYQEQPRENNRYGTAIRKEQNILKHLMQDRIA